eukprot:scaffold65433_cov66-Phaeocystis_antarctica.AAC.12
MHRQRLVRQQGRRAAARSVVHVEGDERIVGMLGDALERLLLPLGTEAAARRNGARVGGALREGRAQRHGPAETAAAVHLDCDRDGGDTTARGGPLAEDGRWVQPVVRLRNAALLVGLGQLAPADQPQRQHRVLLVLAAITCTDSWYCGGGGSGGGGGCHPPGGMHRNQLPLLGVVKAAHLFRCRCWQRKRRKDLLEPRSRLRRPRHPRRLHRLRHLALVELLQPSRRQCSRRRISLRAATLAGVVAPTRLRVPPRGRRGVPSRNLPGTVRLDHLERRLRRGEVTRGAQHVAAVAVERKLGALEPHAEVPRLSVDAHHLAADAPRQARLKVGRPLIHGVTACGRIGRQPGRMGLQGQPGGMGVAGFVCGHREGSAAAPCRGRRAPDGAACAAASRCVPRPRASREEALPTT